MENITIEIADPRIGIFVWIPPENIQEAIRIQSPEGEAYFRKNLSETILRHVQIVEGFTLAGANAPTLFKLTDAALRRLLIQVRAIVNAPTHPTS